MHNLSETSSFDLAVSVPDDAIDYRTAASLLPSLQALANRTRKIYTFLNGFTGSVSFLGDIVSGGSVIALSGTVQGLYGRFIAGLEVDGNSNLIGAVACSGSLAVTGAATCNGGLTVTGAGLTTSSVNCTGNIVASGTTALQACSVTNLTVSSTATFNAGVQVGGTSNVFGPIACTSRGRMFRPAVLGLTTTTVIDPDVASVYAYPSTLSANTTATITDRFFDGETIFVSNLSPAHTVTINLPGGSPIGSALQNVSGGYLSYTICRIGGVYTVIDYSKVP